MARRNNSTLIDAHQIMAEWTFAEIGRAIVKDAKFVGTSKFFDLAGKAIFHDAQIKDLKKMDKELEKIAKGAKS